ncbi:hypothetical protein HII31_11351 [Pseudocercospora fuligena]|uniref:Hydrophobin n=1 Tax=Pseudocercospora fuligena TaxID=685502 RepID=A0A8H6RA34_9PEZI|nr:hypothetical protein HII31_11351 [Pseudocercospora fuligena]
MQFTTVFTIFATAALAMGAAVPSEPSGASKPESSSPSSPEIGSSCGNKQEKVACCNGAAGSSGTLSLLNQVLGGSCALDVLGSTCSQGNVACCPTTQNNEGITVINIGSPCNLLNL